VTLRWPFNNIGASLPNLLATIAGNLFELRQITGLKLLDIRLPDAFADAYAGPRFGIEGTRKWVGLYARPVLILSKTMNCNLTGSAARLTSVSGW